MKNLKRMFSLLLSIVMVLGVSVSALASSITIENPAEGHTYKVYQIFKGTLDPTTNNLTNINWGSGINTATINSYSTDSAQTIANGLSDDNVNEFANDISDYLSYTEYSELSSGSITGLDDGYYLVVDDDDETGEYTANSASILKVAGDVKVTLKSSIPTVQKKVKDTNDSVANSTTGWQDSADYDIGDKVPFQLTATLGENVERYNAYEIMFVDTLSTGLTYNKGSVTVKILDKNGKEVKDISNYCTVVNDGQSLKIYCADVKILGAESGYKIVAEYNATLNENANVGSQGNPNKVYLTYSNNPNMEYEGFTDILEDSDKDGIPDEPEAPGTDEDGNPKDQTGSEDIPNPAPGSDVPYDDGKTTTDEVIVYTYKVVIKKYTANADGSDKQLATGAKFTLYKKDANGEYSIEVGKYTDTNLNTFTFNGIDDGDYKLVEDEAPSGYNKCDDILFTVEATHVTDGDAKDLALTALTATLTSGSAAVDGSANVITGEVSTGTISADVINKPGSNLPSTGGMGTKLFYIFGGLLVLAASVLLITRKRMSNN